MGSEDVTNPPPWLAQPLPWTLQHHSFFPTDQPACQLANPSLQLYGSAGLGGTVGCTGGKIGCTGGRIGCTGSGVGGGVGGGVGNGVGGTVCGISGKAVVAQPLPIVILCLRPNGIQVHSEASFAIVWQRS